MDKWKDAGWHKILSFKQVPALLETMDVKPMIGTIHGKPDIPAKTNGVMLEFFFRDTNDASRDSDIGYALKKRLLRRHTDRYAGKKYSDRFACEAANRMNVLRKEFV